MNMNFHAAHHLWPSIPYYNLPVASRELHEHPLGTDIECCGSYLGRRRACNGFGGCRSATASGAERGDTAG